MKIDKRKGEHFEDAIFLKFDYDFNIIQKIKTYKNRFYHPSTKEWELPAYMEKTVRSDFPEEFSYIDVHDAIHLKPLNKELDLGEIPEDFTWVEKPLDHQIEAVRFGVKHNKFLLADEMGLGKSYEALNIARLKKVKRCLIICGVNSIKWNWKKEVEKFTEDKAWVLGQRLGKKNKKWKVGKTADKFKDLENIEQNDSRFFITNIETLRTEKIVAKLVELCGRGEIDMILFDEAHICSNPDSLQAKGLLSLDCPYKIAMTGTPIMNKPIDLFTIFNWLGVYKDDFWSFKTHYCVLKQKVAYYKKNGEVKTRKYWDIAGWQNIEELQEKLGNIIIRRLKKDVLDLPTKTYIDEFVEMEEDQENYYNKWAYDLIEDRDDTKTSRQNKLVKLIRLRQVTGDPEIFGEKIESAKLNRMKNLVDEAVANGHSVIVYTNWRRMSDSICKKLSDYSISIINGSISDTERVVEEEKFQTGQTQVLVGTIKAIAQGLTLTKGSVEIFMDEPWTQAKKDQCTDRCHRIGQEQKVTIYTLITKDSVDEKVHDIVERKANISNSLVDGESDETSFTEETLDYLLEI